MADPSQTASSATAAADAQMQTGQTPAYNFTPVNSVNSILSGTRGAPLYQPILTPHATSMSGGDHMGVFYQNWNNNPKWRMQLITGYIASGGDPKKANDSWTMQNVWQSLGQASSDSKETGHPMTPMQILAFMAGKAGTNANANAQSLAKDTTDTRYNIEDPATALAITTSVLTAALGRQATPDEVSRYKNAIAAYDRANPTVTHTHTDANGNSTSTSRGGATQPGEQAVVQSMVGNSAEGQAYQTNNVFDQAMKILAGL
jgi:hypothetical protein